MLKKEYIERDALIKMIGNKPSSPTTEREYRLINAFISTVGNFPAADVRPVVRAHWYWDKDGMDWNIGAWRCSSCKAMSPMWWNCDKGSPMHKSGHRYCPNCGAAMEER